MEAIRIRSQDPYVFQVEEYYKKAEADAEIAKIMAIAYPDGPMADAAVPMSRYEPLLKSERELRDRLVILEARR